MTTTDTHLDRYDTSEYAEVYRDDAGELRWRVRDSDNDNILGDSGEGYADERDLFKALERVTNRKAQEVESKARRLDPYRLPVVRLDADG